MRTAGLDRWHRVIDLRPRLRSSARVDRQQMRQSTWYLLSMSSKVRSQRLSAAGWSFIGRCNGELTVQQIWDAMLAVDATDLPTQTEIVQLLVQLYGSGFLEFEQAPEVELMFTPARGTRRDETVEQANPLSFAVPLGDPSHVLLRCGKLARGLFGRAGLFAWVSLMATAALLALVHVEELMRQVALTVAAPRFLLFAWIIYPFIRLVHEAGHALALTAYGAPVREVGIRLFMLLPIPYVDTSETSLLEHRSQRVSANAAGLIAEAALIAAGLIVWLLAPVEILSQLGLTTAILGTVSMLAFNVNPLIRLDGYYLLCELTEQPNLARRSSIFWQQWALRCLIRPAQLPGTRIERSDRLPVALFAPAAWTYRIVVVVLLLTWSNSYHDVLGLVVGTLSLFGLVLWPIIHSMAHLLRNIPAGQQKRSARLRMGCAAAAIVALLVLVPLPERTVIAGVVWVDDTVQVRAAAAGFIRELASSSRPLRAGDTVVRLSDPSVDIERQQLELRRASLEQARTWFAAGDAENSKLLMDELAALARRTQALDRTIRGFELITSVGGNFVARQRDDLTGQYIKAGELVGFVLGQNKPFVRVALAQQQTGFLPSDAIDISLRLARPISAPISGRLRSARPIAIEQLPSAVLGSRAAGAIAVDPADPEGTRVLAATLAWDIEADGLPNDLIGAQVQVRFDYGRASAALKLFRYLNGIAMTQFAGLPKPAAVSFSYSGVPKLAQR